jgi:hypothetical protein
MPYRVLLFLLLWIGSSTAFSQSNSLLNSAPSPLFTIGGDRYGAGKEIESARETNGDLFLAGWNVSVSAAVAGTAHLAGGKVTVEETIAGGLYSAGRVVAIDADIGGNASLAAAVFTQSAGSRIAGNLRVAAESADLFGRIDGALLIAAEEVVIEGQIGGDVILAAERLIFGPDARIEGTLFYTTPEAIEIPASVIAPDRVTYDLIPHAALEAEPLEQTSFDRLFAKTRIGIVIAWLVGALLLFLVAPRLTTRAETLASRHFWRTLGVGLVSIAALIGLILFLPLTLVGLILVPFLVIALPISMALGRIYATYVISRGLLKLLRLNLPSGLLGRWLPFAIGHILIGLLFFFLPLLLSWLLFLFLWVLGVGLVVAKLPKRKSR